MIEAHVHHEENRTSLLGFWIYLMTDLIMFSVLFACYAVLHTSTFGGPSTHDIFNLPFVLVETLILLTSSFTMGLAMIATHHKKIKSVVTSLVVTGVLGLVFLIMELSEFTHLIHDGHSYTQSAFLSSYFTLVGTHGLHIALGLLWIIIMICIVLGRGLKDSTVRKLTMLSLFWHFLDIVWIFIFTVVYIMGVLH